MSIDAVPFKAGNIIKDKFAVGELDPALPAYKC